jgi:beta-lactam-binding protein with PASTA domain
MLNHDTQLFPHHLDEKRMYDFSRPVAEMKQHPTNLNVWGLKNISDEKWVSKLSDGTVKDVEPGQSVSLATGTKILFETSEGEIRASGRSENREEELSLVTDTRR